MEIVFLLDELNEISAHKTKTNRLFDIEINKIDEIEEFTAQIVRNACMRVRRAHIQQTHANHFGDLLDSCSFYVRSFVCLTFYKCKNAYEERAGVWMHLFVSTSSSSFFASTREMYFTRDCVLMHRAKHLNVAFYSLPNDKNNDDDGDDAIR